MGLENRRSGNVSEGSNPSLSAISPENAGFSSDDVSRCSRCVPDGSGGASVGTVGDAGATRHPLNLDIAKVIVTSSCSQLSPQMQAQAVYELEQACRDASKWRKVADDLANALAGLTGATEEVGYVHYAPFRAKARTALASYNSALEGV